MKHVVDSLAEPVAKRWQELQKHYTADNGEFLVASPLSSTPLPVYQYILAHSANSVGWDKTKFVLMDEQVEGEHPPYKYIQTEDPASYEKFANDKFLNQLREKTHAKIPILKPDLDTIDNFDQQIKDHGGIDLLILALGIKGNYANVMPDTSIDVGWHIAHLIPEFRQAHTQAGSQSYEGAKFREYGMSLGPQQVLEAKHVIVIISGKNKRELTEELFSYKDFNPKSPLSIIQEPSLKHRVEVYLTHDVSDSPGSRIKSGMTKERFLD